MAALQSLTAGRSRWGISGARVLLLLGLGAALAFSCTPPDRGIVVDGSLGGSAGAAGGLGGDSAGGASGGAPAGGRSGGGAPGGGASGGGTGGTGGGSGGGSGGEPVACEDSGNCPTAAMAICDLDAGECRTCEDHDECETARPDTPFCDAGGACVECLNGTHCPADEFVCNAGTCRGCQEHSECDSLVCLPDGTCAEPSAIVYARANGITGAGCGTRQEPCQVLAAAMNRLSPSRPYLVFMPSATAYAPPQATVTLPEAVDVTIIGNAVEIPLEQSPGFEIAGGTVTLDGVVLRGNVDEASDPELVLVNATGGTLLVRNAVFSGAHYGVRTTDTELEVLDSEFSSIMTQATIVACSTDCTGVGPTIVERNRFLQSPGGCISSYAAGSQVLNNLLVDVAHNGIAIAIGIGGAESVIAHNTLIGSGVCTFPPLIACSGGASSQDAIVRGNVSYQSGIRGDCEANVYSMCPAPEYSVMEVLIPGTGNFAGDPRFVDAAGGDYRLAADSPAVDLVPADAGLVDQDLDRNPRPVDGEFDAGAYERQ